jgi:hypothetical protein
VNTFRAAAATAVLLSTAMVRVAGAADRPKYSAEVPSSIQTPSTVETRIGTLKFTDGAPDAETVQRVYDNLDFGRGVETFLSGMPAASVYAACKGLESLGARPNQGFWITENLMDARSLFLTPNSTTVYVGTCVDLSKGPVVLEVPPGVLGPVDDAYFRYVTDIGLVGPDKGKGGKYLLVASDWKGDVPSEGYFVARSPTYSNLIFFRAFMQGGDIPTAVAGVKAKARIYPLALADSPPATTFVNGSGRKFNTIHANDFSFYEELDTVVQHEPDGAFDPETTGLWASIGIKKGRPFQPDARMRKLLTSAVAVGNATARAIVFASRDPRVFFYPDRKWLTAFVGGSYLFADGGERMLDARSMFHYYATGITPAMAGSAPGTGSAYAAAFRDRGGKYLDGAKTYRVTLPGPVPAKQFWSFTAYDNQTRSMLETDQLLAGLDSTRPDVKPNADSSYTIWFGPKPPKGKEGNWVQTMPGKGWNVLLRLYGPTEPWFDKTWKPGDFELVD